MHGISKTSLAVIAIGGLLLAGVALLPRKAAEPGTSTDTAFQIDESLLKTGDLIFRRGHSLTSRVVLSADKRSSYSHVGILYLTDDGPLVIHAVPGDHFSNAEPVKAEPLSTFVDSQYASALTIRRLEKFSIAEQAAKTAFSYVQEAILFDADFALDSVDKMYCTELVWRAFQESGIDLVDGVFDKLVLPLGDGYYILPSSLLNSPYLTEVLTLSH